MGGAAFCILECCKPCTSACRVNNAGHIQQGPNEKGAIIAMRRLQSCIVTVQQDREANRANESRESSGITARRQYSKLARVNRAKKQGLWRCKEC